MSLRVRLLTVIVLLLVTYGVTARLIVSAQREVLTEQADMRLEALPPAMTELVRQPAPEGVGVTDVVVPAGQENPFTELYIGAVAPDGSVQPLVVGAIEGSPPDITGAVDATNGGEGIVTIRSESSSTRFRAIVTYRAGEGGWIVAAQSLEEADAAIDRLSRTLWTGGAVLTAVLGVAWFWVQRHGLRPIARVTAAAEAITAGDRSHRVEVEDRHTEAGKLADAFNLMLDERDLSETRLRQFIADASHELRTPLTSVQGYLELYRQGAFRDREALDDVVRRLSAESARMHGLVEDLLVLASLDEGRPLRFEPVDLGQILRDAAQDARAVQPDRAVTVILPRYGPTPMGDPARLTQLTGILVSNALAHTPVTAPIILRADQEPGATVITVADQGPGLDAEAAAHVFDRFWRGQTGRTRAKGQRSGAGLGLAIARSITEAHGGTIALDTAPGAGCTFTVRLPAQREAIPATSDSPAPTLSASPAHS